MSPLHAGHRSVLPKSGQHPKTTANIFERLRISTVTAMLFIVADQFQEESCFQTNRAQVLRIMMLSRRMPGCDQSGTRWFVNSANLFAAQPVRSPFRQQIAGQLSLIQIASDLNVGSTGLRGGASPYPLRT